MSNSGNFVISTALKSGTRYNVAIGSQPAGQTCTIVNGSGTIGNADVSNVAVSCSLNTYSLGGSVSGLTSGKVQLNDGTDTVTVSGNDRFTFPTALAAGTRYGVTVSSQPAGQTCTIANASGTLSDNVSNVAVSCAANPPATYTLGGTVSGLVSGTQLQLSDGTDTATISGNGPFAFPTALTTGTRYTVAVSASQPMGQTCTVSNGSGTIATANVSSVAVSCRRNEYAYVANYGDGTVSQYTIGPDGALTPMNPPTVDAGGQANSVAAVTVDPTGRYAYVANAADSFVWEYAIGQDGALTRIGTLNVALNAARRPYPVFVTVDPAGNYAYVASVNTNTVSQYSIGQDGKLMLTGTPSVSTGGNNTYSLTITERYAYAANNDNVSEYTIDPTDGTLTPTGTITTGANPSYVTVDPSGQYAYVANKSDSSTPGSVSQFTIGTNGGLMAMKPSTVTAGVGPSSVTVDPKGRYAYVANWIDDTVSQYTIDSTGALSPIGTKPVPAGINPRSVTVDPSGKYVYVANANNNMVAGSVSQYTIDEGGALIPNGTTRVPAGLSPWSVITTYARTQ